MFPKHYTLTPIAIVCAALCHVPAYAQESVLPEVVVSGKTSRQAALPESNRLGVSVQETPQAITVIGRDLIRAQNAERLEDVMQNVPGVTQSSGHSGIFSNFVLRGFQLDNTSSYFKDGLRFDRQSQQSLQNIEQVEVIRGPASMQYGKIVPGGLINFVTKKPGSIAKQEVTLYANQFGQIEGGLDSTGKVNESGSVLYRLNAEAKKLDSFRDYVDGSAYHLSPSFTFKLSDATLIDVSLEHNRLNTLRDPGQPAPTFGDIGSVTRLDPEKFYGEENADNTVRTTSGTFRITHRLNDTWQLRGDYNNSRYDRDMFFTFNSGLVGSEVSRRANYAVTELRSETIRTEALGNFSTGQVQHKLLAGIDHLDRDATDDLGTGASINPRIDLFNPTPAGNVVYNQTLSETTKTKVRNTGIYLQDQMEFGRLSVMVGLRHDRLREDLRYDDFSVPATPSTITSKTDTSQTSPSAGVMYKVLPTVSLYASYSRSLDSNVASDNCGRNFKPSRGTQYEAGVKGFAFANDLQWAVAAFDLKRTNGLVDDINGTLDAMDLPCQMQGGEQRSTGIELEASGRIAKGLRLHGAYTHLNARVTEHPTSPSSPSRVGNTLKNTAERSARLWTEYAFDGSLRGLAASVGMSYVGQRYANDDNTLTIPSHTVWDAGLRYTFSKHDTVQVALKNLTDKRYVQDAQNSNIINQGSPRSISVRYTRRFF